MKCFILLLSVFFSFNLFSQKIYIKCINIEGNKRTHIDIILRELTFNQSDSIDILDLNQHINRSRENIYNLGLFNFVELSYDSIDLYNNIELTIDVLERWYLWPIPIVEHTARNFGAWLHEREYDRISLGIFVMSFNMRGRNETLMLKIRPGWREQYGFLYSIPTLNKNKTLGLTFTYLNYRNKFFLANINENRAVYHSSSDYSHFQNLANLTFSYRPYLYFINKLSVTYNDFYITNSVLNTNPDYIGKSKNSAKYFSLAIETIFDKRNIAAYPTKGYLAGTKLQKNGFGFFDSEIKNFFVELYGSKYYNPFERFVLASYLNIGIKDIDYKSFIFEQAVGYNNYVRGMEMNIINGRSSFLSKTNLAYNILKTRVNSFGPEKYNKFLKLHYAAYLTFNFDMAYVYHPFPSQTMQNNLVCGYGPGIDIVTYYDRVFRIEYSMNSFGEKRVYLHFHAPF